MDLNGVSTSPKMDEVRTAKQDEEKPIEVKAEDQPQVNGVAEAVPSPEAKVVEAQAKETTKEKTKSKKECKHKKSKKKKKKSKKPSKDDSSSDSDTADSDATDTPSDSDSDSSSDEDERRKKKKKAKKAKQKSQKKKKSKSKRYETSSSESSDSDESESESEDESDRRRKRRSRKGRKTESEAESEADEDEEDVTPDEAAAKNAAWAQYVKEMQLRQMAQTRGLRVARRPATDLVLQEALAKQSKKAKKDAKKKKDKKPKKGSTLEYKRVDQLWDSTIHNYKLTESAEDRVDEFDEFLFTVRRNFNWENKYRDTVVDIKSKPLRDALAEVMKDVKCVSLVEEQPCLDPNILFLYLEDIRTYYKKTLKSRAKKERKSKIKRKIKETMKHCKVLVSYLDEDYDDIKKRLYPMLEAGNITFDLLWALFKPNSIAVTSTYGAWDEPRCFKVDYANKETSFVKGEWYCIEGRYLEYDGKNFGLGDFEIDIDHFQGPRRITSLSTYPLHYHKEKETVKKKLIERGKRFIELAGMNYRFHQGLAFHKKRKTVFKFNINGRIMIDPAIFRRINPNYPISLIKPKDQDDLFSDDDTSSCGCDSDSDGLQRRRRRRDSSDEGSEKPTTKFKVIMDDKDEARVVEVPIDEDGNEIRQEKLETVGKDDEVTTKEREFTEEELLIASPVVLGFAFSEKQWLEFTLSGVRDIQWNDGAFDSLVIPADRKLIVKALVSSHKFHPAQTIDDVVQGKGKGRVFLLHGPPGVGKTLTGEGIAEYLKCPLYAVGAGDLGTDSHVLEQELQKIMDIAHSWGAVLLLDEADVFLEKRQHQDVHRNALVSIFLRLLEYFQGILFLTTNRVDTFDEAFQSRIHLALRYDELTFKARKEIWKMFLEKVRVVEEIETMPFKDEDYSQLARHNLNGRQVCLLSNSLTPNTLLTSCA